MSQHISELGDITTITPAQEAAVAKANSILDFGVPMAYEGRGDSVQFIYNDLSGDDADLRLILEADGTFGDLQRWEGPDFVEIDCDDDWASIDGGELATLVQEALSAL
jgi:hypothetical protein